MASFRGAALGAGEGGSGGLWHSRRSRVCEVPDRGPWGGGGLLTGVMTSKFRAVERSPSSPVDGAQQGSPAGGHCGTVAMAWKAAGGGGSGRDEDEDGGSVDFRVGGQLWTCDWGAIGRKSCPSWGPKALKESRWGDGDPAAASGGRCDNPLSVMKDDHSVNSIAPGHDGSCGRSQSMLHTPSCAHALSNKLWWAADSRSTTSAMLAPSASHSTFPVRMPTRSMIVLAR